MAKVWELKTEKLPESLVENLGEYPKFFQHLLYNRGLTEKDEIEEFLNPKYENLHSPFLFKDMQKAVERIWEAIDDHQKICIYGDYDADAVTANAVLQQAFRYLGVEVASYIPDRFTEGYGVNMEALEKIKDSGCKIIVTVDCGTNSIDAADFCNANGIDLIITDHHEIIGDKPKAFALINPKNREDGYPYEDITGVGVAFKLACGILSHYEKVSKSLSSRAVAVETRDPGQNQEMDSGSESGITHREYAGGYEKWLLDLVAIGTVADCHSLQGENRILVKFGLKVLAKTKWTGLKALMSLAKVDVSKPLDAYILGFIIAPRLNAAGRLEHADLALDLLMEKNPEAAAQKAVELEEVNRRRQDQTLRIVSEAKEQAIVFQDRKVIVVAGEGWSKGIVGLVAGRLAEEFYKPVIVLEKTTEFSTGSARTVGAFNILEALKHASEHLVRFGGHKQAAGLTLETVKLEVFYQKVLDYAEINIPSETSRVLELEAELDESQLSIVNCQLLQQLEPFGIDNPKPKFLISALEILELKPVGKTGQHFQIRFQKDNVRINSIYFNSANFVKNLKIGDTVDVAGELQLDEWNGKKEIKLRVVDLRNHINI